MSDTQRPFDFGDGNAAVYSAEQVLGRALNYPHTHPEAHKAALNPPFRMTTESVLVTVDKPIEDLAEEAAQEIFKLRSRYGVFELYDLKALAQEGETNPTTALRLLQAFNVLKRITDLDNDAHPGLFTWCEMRAKCHKEAEAVVKELTALLSKRG